MTSSGPQAGPSSAANPAAGPTAAEHQPTGIHDVERATAAALAGGDAARWPGTMPVRDRVQLLLDPGSWTEDGLLAAADSSGLPTDGVLTGTGTVDGRRVAVIADAVVAPARLRGELASRLAAADGWERPAAQRHHVVSPV